MADSRERRQAPRFAIAGRLATRARATLDVTLVDLSLTGARIEHDELLRPGSTCTLELPSTLGPQVLTARVVRSKIIGSQQTLGGDRILRYESGLTFLKVTAQQQAALEQALKGLTPEGGPAEGRLVP